MPTLSFIKVVNGWPTIEIGKMRHAITIQSLGPTSPPTFDAAGEVMAWQVFLPAVASPPDYLMAAIEPISGKDLIKGGQATTQLLLSIAIWYQPGILPSMRVISDNGSKYVIQSIENVLELNIVLTLNVLAINENL